MSKHTAGPWKVDHDSDEVAVVMGSAIDSQCGYFTAHRWICELEWHDEDDEAEANARLIAAAPDLLEFVMEWLDRQGTDNNYMTSKARAAIAKATGEAQ